jgi:hypothetical protein
MFSFLLVKCLIFLFIFQNCPSYDIVVFLCFSVILTEQGLVLFSKMNFTIYLVGFVMQAEISKSEATPAMRQLNELLHLHDRGDDDKWIKKCRKSTQ